MADDLRIIYAEVSCLKEKLPFNDAEDEDVVLMNEMTGLMPAIPENTDALQDIYPIPEQKKEHEKTCR